MFAHGLSVILRRGLCAEHVNLISGVVPANQTKQRPIPNHSRVGLRQRGTFVNSGCFPRKIHKTRCNSQIWGGSCEFSLLFKKSASNSQIFLFLRTGSRRGPCLVWFAERVLIIGKSSSALAASDLRLHTNSIAQKAKVNVTLAWARQDPTSHHRLCVLLSGWTVSIWS